MSIVINNLSFSYSLERKIFENLNLEISKNQITSIVGESGLGKSTLLEILVGLQTNYDGEISIDNQIIDKKYFKENMKNRVHKILLVFQNSSLQLFLPTVREELLSTPQKLKYDMKEIEKKRKEYFTYLNLTDDFLDKKIYYLSGGEKKKIAIIASLLLNPDYIILDEPTIGLDVKSSYQILKILKKYCGDNKTVILVTHDMRIMKEISDEIILFEKNIVSKFTYDDFIKSEYTLKKKMISVDDYYLRLINDQLKKNYETIDQFVIEYHRLEDDEK